MVMSDEEALQIKGVSTVVVDGRSAGLRTHLEIREVLIELDLQSYIYIYIFGAGK